MRYRAIALALLLWACGGAQDPGDDSLALIGDAHASGGKKPSGGGQGLHELAPYFPSGPAAEAISNLSKNPKEAAKTLQSLAKKASGEDAVRLTFLSAIALSRAGDHKAAAPLFADLKDRYQILSSYAAAFGAESYLLLKEGKKAAELAALVPEDEPLGRFALRIRAEALELIGDSGAEEALSAYLKAAPRSPEGAALFFRLAELRRKKGDKEGAAAAYRAILAGWPLSPSVKEAEASLASLKLPSKHTELTAEEAERRAEVFYKAQKHKEAEKAYAEVLDKAPAKSALRCRALFYQAKSVYNQRAYDRAGDLFGKAAAACKGTDDTLRAWSFYNTGKSYQRAGKCKDAAKAYLSVEKEFPKESLADDARLHRGECLLEEKDPKAEEVLLSVPVDFPEGDMGEEAIWVLAWQAFRDKDYDRAELFLQKGLKALDKVTNFWAEGRLGYWYARVREIKKDKAGAKDAYVKVIKDYPLSYYARMASLRLSNLDPKAIPPLAAPKEEAPAALENPFDTPAAKEPAFARGLELLRLGLFAYAKDELARLPSETEETLWLLADLYDRAGAYPFSHDIPRRRLPQFRFEDPSLPLGARRWKIAYPIPFASLITEWSEKHKAPLPLSFAIMREESAFNAGIESFAHAVGLMQLILPTARSMAKEMGKKVNLEDLRDPAVNIPLGTRYLGFLIKYFDGHVGLAVAAYNAGQGAVGKWKKAFGKIPFDEFVERIPYEETRRYTKRVLTSYETYAYLYNLPKEEISLEIP